MGNFNFIYSNITLAPPTNHSIRNHYDQFSIQSTAIVRLLGFCAMIGIPFLVPIIYKYFAITDDFMEVRIEDLRDPQIAATFRRTKLGRKSSFSGYSHFSRDSDPDAGFE